MVAALATLVSIVFGRDLHVAHMLLLGASSMSTALIASASLGAIMVAVIVLSHTVKINPDNVATPIAASLGDLVTLGLLSVFANWLYDLSGELSDCLSVCLVCLSVCQCIYLCLCVYVCLSLCVCVCLSLCLWLSLCLSAYLFICFS